MEKSNIKVVNFNQNHIDKGDNIAEFYENLVDFINENARKNNLYVATVIGCLEMIKNEIVNGEN